MDLQRKVNKNKQIGLLAILCSYNGAAESAAHNECRIVLHAFRAMAGSSCRRSTNVSRETFRYPKMNFFKIGKGRCHHEVHLVKKRNCFT